jgi:translation elongation factor P/translation initiation factor 5A
MKTGKIKYITPKGKGTPFIDNQTGEQVVFDNYNIGFADGIEYKFKAKGEWKYPVGSEIQFEVSNEQYKTAKGAKLIQSQEIPLSSGKTTSRPINTNDSILLQVCFKECMQAYAKDNDQIVIPRTKEYFKELKEFLNSI